MSPVQVALRDVETPGIDHRLRSASLDDADGHRRKSTGPEPGEPVGFREASTASVVGRNAFWYRRNSARTVVRIFGSPDLRMASASVSLEVASAGFRAPRASPG